MMILHEPNGDPEVFTGYYSCEDGGHDCWMEANGIAVKPTHWKPLPPAP